LAELPHDVSQEFELEADRAGIELRVDAPRQAAMVRADIGLMQRVLETLLRNAIKFTPNGGAVTIRLEPNPGAVSVAIVDTGCGIPDAELEKIFDRFYRSETSASIQQTSTGLGLAIVKRILDLHGSRITVTSSVNQGKRFVFERPTAEAA